MVSLQAPPTSHTLGARPVIASYWKSLPRLPNQTQGRMPRQPCAYNILADIADAAPQVAAAGSSVADQANKLTPGSVSAPNWVIPAAIVAVTLGGILSGYLLKPGADAAEKVFQRDAKRIGNQARAKAKGLKR